MKADIGTRETITVAVDGFYLRGTYHRPLHRRTDEVEGMTNGASRTGILFLNTGWQPRAGTGNGSVYWADSFANIGYPSIRLDMPGLGDSEGDLPASVVEFISHINAGGHTAVLCHAIESLIRRFGLSGAVLVGHCAGAVSALYAAEENELNVRGLILLDPYFHLQSIATQPLKSSWFWPTRAVKRLQVSCDNTWRHLLLWAYRTQPGNHLQTMHDYVRYLRMRGRQETLPKNANLRLIRTFTQLASEGLPMLLFTAPPDKPKVGEFDYFRFFQMTAYNSIVLRPVEGTDHFFVKGDGKESVRALTEQWLRAFFPLSGC